MKTTLEIPDDLFRQSKATAAMRGVSLKDFVTAALQAYLDENAGSAEQPGWMKVFGRAEISEVNEIDQVIEKEFGQVREEDWI